MKIIRSLIGFILLAAGFSSCEDVPVEAKFEDMIDMTIYDFVVEGEEYSHFLRIMEQGGIDKTLSAYNPDGLGYTLFLPTNDAIDRFIQESDQYASLDDLLADQAYVETLSRYHAVNMGINADDFPFGALPAYTLSGDILTVSFIIETDTSYYSINNQSPVIVPNNETSNGFVHVINEVLVPVTLTTFGWLEQHPGYSLFLEAVNQTGLEEMLDLNTRDEEQTARPFTLLLEHDSIFNRRGIQTFEELAARISPDNNDYTNILNPLYNFVTYHMLTETRFLDDFEDVATNYTTYSDIPLNINGNGLDIMINKGKQVFDTIIQGTDTTIIDFIGFKYDESNIITQSGALHFIDQILEQVPPSRAIQTFEFYEEPLFNEFRQEPGEYLVEDSAALYHIRWKGSELLFVEEADPNFPAWGKDYIALNGDFSIEYEVPRIIQGNYLVILGAEAYNASNALVEVFIDGKKLGELIDLTWGGSADNPFTWVELGTINFLKYEQHIIQVKSLIPGRFLWDLIRFEPY
jgi:uncharacterized surface protein with fasciclin (FAS1) repeats